MSRSGCIAWMRRPTLIQLIGLQELTCWLISKSVGAFSVEYCVFPGKRNDGYCRVKVMISTWCPSACNWRASRSLKVAKPPRKGYAVPSSTMFMLCHFVRCAPLAGCVASRGVEVLSFECVPSLGFERDLFTVAANEINSVFWFGDMTNEINVFDRDEFLVIV